MSLPPPPRRLDLASVGRVTVVTFRDEWIVDELVIQEVGDQLLGLVEDQGHRNLLLNFGSVHALSSAALAKLFRLEDEGRLDPGEAEVLLRPPRADGGVPAPPVQGFRLALRHYPGGAEGPGLVLKGGLLAAPFAPSTSAAS